MIVIVFYGYDYYKEFILHPLLLSDLEMGDFTANFDEQVQTYTRSRWFSTESPLQNPFFYFWWFSDTL